MGQRAAVTLGALLVAAGGSALGYAAAAQRHAPQPGHTQAGVIGPADHGSQRSGPGRTGASGSHCSAHRCGGTAGASGSGATNEHGPVLASSRPVSIAIPAIGVRSTLLYVGLNRNGTLQAPPLNHLPQTNEAAWYKYSPTPGAVGPSIIEGHVDSARYGPSVFFRLGALKPGDRVDVTLADHQVAVFTVTGVRMYPKDRFPTATVYGGTDYAALRLLTCGGSFDDQTHHYLSNIVVFAALTSAHPA